MNATNLSVGFDAKRIVRNGTGLGSYGRTLVNELAALPLQLHLYAPDEGREELRSQVVERDNVTFHFPAQASTALGKAMWRSRGIVNDLRRDGIQVFHGLSGELPIGIRKSGIKSVVTIHDLIFLRHPEYYHWLDTRIYAWKFRRTVKEADHIVAISECTKRDIMEYAQVDSSKISVVYQSCAPRFNVSDNAQWPSPSKGSGEGISKSRYILSVGSIEERKNLLLAVKALHWLPEEIKLVAVGRHTKYTDRVTDYVKAHHLEHRVSLRHDVTNDELPALYAGAEAFVYPSRYEGFGIPVIEAICCGLPVVACTGSCLEEAGGPHSLYVAPDDERGMAHAISSVLKGSDGREQRIALSRDYVRRFEGNQVANQMAELYEELKDPLLSA